MTFKLDIHPDERALVSMLESHLGCTAKQIDRRKVSEIGLFIQLHQKHVSKIWIYSLDCLELPEELMEFPHLDVLFLKDLDIHSIPDSIRNLDRLSELYSINNPLLCLPSSLFYLRNLKKLIIKHSSIQELPKNFHKLYQLSELKMPNNQISKLYVKCFSMPFLSHLDISRNIITDVPDLFGDLDAPNLKTCDFSYNPLNHISSKNFQLSSLRLIWISNSNLKSFPISNFANLRNLSDLDLSRNHIAEIPENFMNLPALEHLNLAHNEILTLPPTFQNFPLLSSLDLSHNQITDISEDITRFPKLIRLNMSYNSLTKMPTIMKSGEIFLQYNKIDSIPNALPTSYNFGVIDLSYNQIDGIEQLPTPLFSNNFCNFNLRGNPIYDQFAEAFDNFPSSNTNELLWFVRRAHTILDEIYSTMKQNILPVSRALDSSHISEETIIEELWNFGLLMQALEICSKVDNSAAREFADKITANLPQHSHPAGNIRL